MKQAQEMKEQKKEKQEPNWRGQRQVEMWVKILTGEEIYKEMGGRDLQQGKETKIVVERVGMMWIEGGKVKGRMTDKRKMCAHFTCAINVSMEMAVEMNIQNYVRIQCCLGHAPIRRIPTDTILICVER